MAQQSLVFLIGGASLLALHTVRLWYSYKRGDTVTDDSGGDPYRIGLSHVLLALRISRTSAFFSAPYPSNLPPSHRLRVQTNIVKKGNQVS